SLRLFEKHLLEILGYGLTLDHEAETGRPIEAGALYRYHLERGAVRGAAGGGMGVQVSGDTLLALAAESLTGREQLREARLLLQAALERHLGGRPLKTREVLRAFGKAAG
ncbi:MAG: DNA repair protein RecO C-terminal domain-containing protein, partial [Gammaproteobacteria bacterium]|nr:DNA repair protein RecO C-terminal domain-containing protein [Gammaproteobacteria bacterium]